MLKSLALASVLCCVVSTAHAETCTASHYGHKDGQSSRLAQPGKERLNTYGALTAAHLSRPFGSHVKVTNLRNGRSVVVRINDRGPFIKGRCIDLTYRAAQAIGMDGIAPVNVE
jgi:rare lipoprotein A